MTSILEAIQTLEGDRTQQGLKLRTILLATIESPTQSEMALWCLEASETKHQVSWNLAVASIRLPEHVRQLAMWN